MKKFVLTLLVTAVLASPAQAAVITFDGIPPTGLTTGVFTEAGYDLALAGMFTHTESAGNVEIEPLCCASTGSLTVTRSGGGAFSFDAVDLQLEYGQGPTTLRLEGFLMGVSQGVDTLATSSSAYATFLASVLSGDAIDTLVITGDRDFVSGIAFDNLAVSDAAVPEPGTMLLLALAAAGAAARRRTRE